MVMFIIQSAILLAIAFIAGCIVGCLAHRMLAGSSAESVAAPAPATKPASPTEKPAAAVPASKPEPKKPEPAAAKPTKKAAPAPAAKADDLKKIKGLGRQAEAKLNAAGVTSFTQIAAWTAKDQREWGEKLAFRGRIEREKWVSQAKKLAKGGETEFSKRVGKGEVPSSSGGKPRRSRTKKS